MAEVSNKVGAAPESIGKSAASGVAWSLLLNIVSRVVTLLSQLVMAKLLAPAEFGILGLAYTITFFFSGLTSFGIQEVFQQRRGKMHLWATQALVLSLGMAILAALAMAAYAPFGAKLYHDERVASLVWIVAASLPISALSTVPQAKLMAMLRFKFLAIYTSVELVATQFLMIVFALCGLGAVSFVLPLPLLAIVRAIVMWRAAPAPLRPLRLAKGTRRMLGRGASVFGLTMLNVCITQGDNITLGLLATPAVVGTYYFAYRIVSQPVLMLAANLTNVLRPTLVTLKREAGRQRDIAFRMAQFLGLVTVPVCFMQAAVAEPGLQLVLGSRWMESVPLIQILSIGLPLDAVSWAAGCLLEARGRFSKSLGYQCVTAPFFFIFVGVGAVFGSSLGVALGVTLYYILHPIYLTAVVFLKEGISLRRILACFYVPVLLAGTTIGGAYAVSQTPMLSGRLVLQIAVVVVLGGSGYLLAVRHWLPDVYSDVRHKLLQILPIERMISRGLSFGRART
jgi:PST family polysaccharide transporter